MGAYFLDDTHPFGELHRVEIVIDTSGLDLEAVEYNITNLCTRILGNMAALQHISLRPLDLSTENHLVTLALFGVLRYMRSVLIHGPVTLPFAERLKGLMLENTPQENEKKMYRLLKKYVHGPKGDPSNLHEKSKALQELDFQRFKVLRSQILLDSQCCMEDALFLLHGRVIDGTEHHGWQCQ
ncbi:hypothetical protein MMC29_001756 [Sticta canariensis]|nr:hypothetical protein [Sticta canariensis]